MGWFDRFLGKRPKPPTSPAKPRVVKGLDDGSPFVVVENENGSTMIMDRMAYEYMYGSVKKPDPSQATIDAMLARVSRIRVWAGGMMRDEPTTQELLAEESDPSAVETFRHAFRISEDPASFSHCMCLGQPTIELLGEDGGRVGTLGMQHGRAVRWDDWQHDAQLLDGQAIGRWLAERGVSEGCMR